MTSEDPKVTDHRAEDKCEANQMEIGFKLHADAKI